MYANPVKLKESILYSFWWPSYFTIYNSHAEYLCSNERLHSNFRRSSAQYWRAEFLLFDAKMLEAMLPKLFVVAEEITLLVLNDLWREHQKSINVGELRKIRMPDGVAICGKRDRLSEDNQNALHRRVVEVLQNPAAFGKYTVQFARNYDVAAQRKDVDWQTKPRNNRPVNVDIRSIGNKTIMFKGVRREPSRDKKRK